MHQQARRHGRLLSLGGSICVAACAASAPLQGGLSSGISGVGGRGDPLSTSQSSKSAERSKVAIPIEVAWNRLAKAYAELGIPLTTMNSADHRLGNEGMRRSHTLANDRLSSFLDCGSGGSGGANADVYAVTVSVVSELRALTDSTTEVATLVQATAKSMSLGTPPVLCATTGSLESQIASRVGGNTPPK